MNDSSSLIERAKAITLQPNDTWPVIATEPATPGDLITRYAVPLSAIGPVASFVGGQLFGISVIVATYHPSLMSGLSMALTSFVMGIVGLIVLALIADFLAPKFDGEANRTQAFKLVTYSMTPGWVAGILGIIPSLAVLGIIASLYGLYLFYLGARTVMKVPEAKAGGYTAVTVLCAIVLAFAMSAVTSSITSLFGGGMAGMMADDSGDKVELNLPGGGSLDSSKIEEAAKNLENAKDVKPADLSALQALLPASLGAYSRTAVESTAAGGMGAQAEGTYTSGDKTIHVKVIDMAALGAVAGILVAPITFTSWDVGVMLGLKGFAAAILGGMGSGAGAVLGGLVLGILEAMGAGYLSSAYKDAIAFVLILVVLFFLPNGLLGKRSTERV